MATSTCSKCGNHSFQLIEVSPGGARYKYYFVQCTQCGVPVGVLPFNNTSAEIEAMEKRVMNGLSVVEENTRTIYQMLTEIIKKIKR